VKHISFFVVVIKQLNEMVREMDIKTKVQIVHRLKLLLTTEVQKTISSFYAGLRKVESMLDLSK
jgi:hypothetical protein